MALFRQAKLGQQSPFFHLTSNLTDRAYDNGKYLIENKTKLKILKKERMIKYRSITKSKV